MSSAASVFSKPPSGTRSDLEQQSSLSPEQEELADLLTLLVEDFEARHYALPRSTPYEVLDFLMDQHNLTLAELNKKLQQSVGDAHLLSPDTTEPLTAQQIRWLSSHFHVSPAVFF